MVVQIFLQASTMPDIIRSVAACFSMGIWFGVKPPSPPNLSCLRSSMLPFTGLIKVGFPFLAE